ncbi:hypothetical protein BpHYR1_047689 [Brachionus plicatilis]|uniref:Uncharacterized protein n=1 Tax=Brachionus plicatilis TaxID=10195 RepID=A0A3M7T3A6_BRAPC|nr:hypothetical protein BpHYR1_047689 [Brachionus plicatilis]
MIMSTLLSSERPKHFLIDPPVNEPHETGRFLLVKLTRYRTKELRPLTISSSKSSSDSLSSPIICVSEFDRSLLLPIISSNSESSE